jgi:hypothetical protein
LALFMRYYAPTAEDLSAEMSKSEARAAR